MQIEQGGEQQFTILFHNAEPSDALKARAEHLLEKLRQFEPSIMRGTVTIEGRHRHHHQGNLYHVAVRLHLPGKEIVANQDPELNHAHEDVYVALRDACEAARRQLESLKRQKGKGLRHERVRFEGNPRKGAPFEEGV
jgi:ribosome-associated translation inhibitor RaiA